MSDFLAVTTCNHPTVKDPEAVDRIIKSYFFDPELRIGTAFDEENGRPYLLLYGYVWPETWKVPEGQAKEDFDPYSTDEYEEGADGFECLLQELAAHLEEPLTVQAIGSEKCRFPLSASQWIIEPQGTEVIVSEFGNLVPTATVEG